MSFKAHLHTYCTKHIQDHIQSLEQAIEALKESMNNETKSSAGDKHETARAMAQLEVEKLSNQYNEAIKQQQALMHIPLETDKNVIRQGSLVTTDKGIFYISTSIGKAVVDEKTVFIISPASPLAQKLMGTKVAAKIDMNGQIYKVLEIN